MSFVGQAVAACLARLRADLAHVLTTTAVCTAGAFYDYLRPKSQRVVLAHHKLRRERDKPQARL
jgi:hypothetical protein